MSLKGFHCEDLNTLCTLSPLLKLLLIYYQVFVPDLINETFVVTVPLANCLHLLAKDDLSTIVDPFIESLAENAMIPFQSPLSDLPVDSFSALLTVLSPPCEVLIDPFHLDMKNIGQRLSQGLLFVLPLNPGDFLQSPLSEGDFLIEELMSDLPKLLSLLVGSELGETRLE